MLFDSVGFLSVSDTISICDFATTDNNEHVYAGLQSVTETHLSDPVLYQRQTSAMVLLSFGSWFNYHTSTAKWKKVTHLLELFIH